MCLRSTDVYTNKLHRNLYYSPYPRATLDGQEANPGERLSQWRTRVYMYVSVYASVCAHTCVCDFGGSAFCRDEPHGFLRHRHKDVISHNASLQALATRCFLEQQVDLIHFS